VRVLSVTAELALPRSQAHSVENVSQNVVAPRSIMPPQHECTIERAVQYALLPPSRAAPPAPAAPARIRPTALSRKYELKGENEHGLLVFFKDPFSMPMRAVLEKHGGSELLALTAGKLAFF
jgi:hypothetical protein